MGDSDGSQQYCLRWNNHSDSIISEFEVLLGQEDFVDVTLSCDKKSVKAHKVISIAHSFRVYYLLLDFSHLLLYIGCSLSLFNIL